MVVASGSSGLLLLIVIDCCCCWWSMKSVRVDETTRISLFLLYCILFHCILFHCIALHCISLYFIVFYGIVKHCSTKITVDEEDTKEHTFRIVSLLDHHLVHLDDRGSGSGGNQVGYGGQLGVGGGRRHCTFVLIV